jgi:hypothetical protein
MPSAFDWPATMNVGMQFDEQFLVCSARLPSRVVDGVVAIPSSCVATLVLARALCWHRGGGE